MFYDCLFSAACQREYLPARPLSRPPPAPHPHQGQGGSDSGGEEGVFDSRPVKLSGVTPLTSFCSWEARGSPQDGVVLMLSRAVEPLGGGVDGVGDGPQSCLLGKGVHIYNLHCILACQSTLLDTDFRTIREGAAANGC